jgi:hypothetical protein
MASGSSSDQPLSVDSESSVYSDFKVYHRQAQDDRLASKKNHIEQNFYILKRIKQSNRTDDLECQCAICSISFKAFNSTQMRVHLTGESQQFFKNNGVGLRQTLQKELLQANQISISGQLHRNSKVQRMWHHWHRSC